MFIRALTAVPTTLTSGGALILYLTPAQIPIMPGILTTVYLLVMPPVATGLFTPYAFEYIKLTEIS